MTNQITIIKELNYKQFSYRLTHFGIESFMLSQFWSPAIFTNNKFNLNEIVRSELMVLRFDENINKARIVRKFKKYKHVIGYTGCGFTHHSGAYTSEIYVVLFLEEPVSSFQHYNDLKLELMQPFKKSSAPSKVDLVCCPCSQILSSNPAGILVPPVRGGIL